MIEAIEIKCNHFVVRSVDPLSGKVLESATVYSEGEALRFAHFCNRTYIIDTMTRWLHQRFKALYAHGFENHRNAAGKLLGEILFHSQTSVSNIRKLIRDNQAVIDLIAPRERSKQYPYYDKTIRSILAFCAETEAVEA